MYICISLSLYIYIYIYVGRGIYKGMSGDDSSTALGGSAAEDSEIQSEQFWMYLNLDMVAPQTFARTFTKPGSRLY